MPELPDLEVLKEVLAPKLFGREIVSARALRPGILKTVTPAVDSLVGEQFTAISRRGKHLIFTLRPDLHVVVHLMRAGRFVICRSDTRLTKATGFVVSFSDGADLRLIENGAIKLAKVHVVVSPQDVDEIVHAGIEPLSPQFTIAALTTMVRGRRRQAKKLITDQRMIAGIGTAYADEILFAAKISPIRYVNTLSAAEIARLHAATVHVLETAIREIRARVGDSLFTDEVRDFLKVYNRTGEPCPVCGTPIQEIRYAQTRTYYCPVCQANGRTIPDRRRWITR